MHTRSKATAHTSTASSATTTSGASTAALLGLHGGTVLVANKFKQGGTCPHNRALVGQMADRGLHAAHSHSPEDGMR